MATSFDPQALRERFNPEGSALRRQQHRMTEMLLAVDRVCRKHNIPYWLSSGTLLGAVRHGGYIPWDDDLDIELLRPDYEHLMRVLPDELPADMVLQTHETDPGYFFLFAKVRDTHSYLSESNRYDRIFRHRGIYIDIFPFEKAPLPLHWISCRAHGFTYKIMKNPRHSDEEARRRVMRLVKLNTRFTFPVLRALSALWPTRLVRYGWGVPYSDPRHLDDIFPLSTVCFEGYDMPAPRDCNAYLTRKFGDYMQLPDLDKLHPHCDEIEFYDQTTDRP